MTWMYGEDWEYADSRLADTVVCHNGRPFHVSHITAVMTAYGTDLVSGKVVEIPARELELTPVKLGYCNFNKKAFYVCRIPSRRYKQGLRKDNMLCKALSGAAARLEYAQLANTIMGVFPDFKKCVASVTALHSMAWHRDWAMDKDGRVYYRGTDIVGSLVEGKVVLSTQFAYLKEALAEVT